MPHLITDAEYIQCRSWLYVRLCLCHKKTIDVRTWMKMLNPSDTENSERLKETKHTWAEWLLDGENPGDTSARWDAFTASRNLKLN